MSEWHCRQAGPILLSPFAPIRSGAVPCEPIRMGDKELGVEMERTDIVIMKTIIYFMELPVFQLPAWPGGVPFDSQTLV